MGREQCSQNFSDPVLLYERDFKRESGSACRKISNSVAGLIRPDRFFLFFDHSRMVCFCECGKFDFRTIGDVAENWSYLYRNYDICVAANVVPVGSIEEYRYSQRCFGAVEFASGKRNNFGNVGGNYCDYWVFDCSFGRSEDGNVYVWGCCVSSFFDQFSSKTHLGKDRR